MSENYALTAVRQNAHISYPKSPPFDPSAIYPEFADSSGFVSTKEENSVYEAVRQCLIDLGLDADRVTTKEWSPFRDFLKPGMTVVIKPNLVLNTLDPDLQNTVTTHGSVIRPVIDYCWKAVGPTGKIIVGDAPQAETDFEVVVSRNGLLDTIKELQKRGVNVDLHDFRGVRVVLENGIWVGEQTNSDRHNNENLIVNLGKSSQFYDPEDRNIHYHGGGYDSSVTRAHHHGEVQEYRVAKEILTADAVISIPKMKTHKKAGITCCLKNLVGINVDKNFLPHFTIGPKNAGGDEMPAVTGLKRSNVRAVRFIRDMVLDKHWRACGKIVAMGLRMINNTRDRNVNLAQKTTNQISGTSVFQGAWPGNDTIWKMILDLNKVFLYANRDGSISDTPVRNVFYLVDGVILGDRNGPMDPTSVNAGIVACGNNALQTDLTLLKLCSVDYSKIPLYSHAVDNENWLVPFSNNIAWFNGRRITADAHVDISIVPPDNWEF